MTILSNGNASPPQTVSVSPPTSTNKPDLPGSAWKISQSKPIPLSTNSPPNTTSISPSTRDGAESEMQLASLIVPNVQPPKVLTKNRVELVRVFTLSSQPKVNEEGTQQEEIRYIFIEKSNFRT
jgi:hypothetical protein